MKSFFVWHIKSNEQFLLIENTPPERDRDSIKEEGIGYIKRMLRALGILYSMFKLSL